MQAWHELQIPRQAEKEMLTLLFEVPGTVTVELAVESVSSGIPVATRVTIEPCTEDCLGLMLQRFDSQETSEQEQHLSSCVTCLSHYYQKQINTK